MLSLVKVPQFIKWVNPTYFWDFNESSVAAKTIYLSFDDGPIPETTPWILDTLANYGIKATFFCIGENAINQPKLLKRILEEGHSVGNHTHNHLDSCKTKTRAYVENTLKAEQVFEDIIPEFTKRTKLFRPPYGKIRRSQAKELMNKGYKIVMYDVLARDWEQRLNPEKCYSNVVNNVSRGSIVVFHDSLKAAKNLKYALPKALEHLKGQGYQFKTI